MPLFEKSSLHTGIFVFIGVAMAGYTPSFARAAEPASTATTAITAVPSSNAPSARSFLVQQNDIWVQVGDSITEQACYTTYLEAFIRARYPKLAFVAVNSGKSGEVTIQGLIRFRRSVAAFKPTLVTSAFGMNDHVKVFTPNSNFQDDPASPPYRFATAVKGLGARYAVISSSPLLKPVENPDDFKNPDGTFKTPGGRTNFANRMFADKMRVVADQSGALFLDQMSPLQSIWGANYERDWVAAVGDAVKQVDAATTPEAAGLAARYFTEVMKAASRNPELYARLPLPDKEKFTQLWSANRETEVERAAYAKYLKAWLATYQASTPPFVRLSGYTDSVRSTDFIHPNQSGHLHMAGVLFKLMNGDAIVSDVQLNADGLKIVKATKATVRDLSLKDGVFIFRRLDDSLPFPIDAAARPALDVDVNTILGTPRDLFGCNRYLLKVSNLPQGTYRLAIDGVEVARPTSAQLTDGIDLGYMNKGPIFDQTQKLLNTVKQNIIMAVQAKGQPAVEKAVKPRVLEEAQPVERSWSLSKTGP